MATRAIAATGEVVVNTETYVSSALAFDVQLTLPAINAGAGATVAVDTVIRLETTAAGKIEVLTATGRRVGILPGRSQAVLVARTGAVQVEPDDWNFMVLPQTQVAVATASPAGGTGAAAGGWDTAGNRDTAITLINAMRTCLINNGFMKAE